MRFICDQCGTKYSIADEKVRNKLLKIRCKNCSHIILVREQKPESVSTEAPAAAASPAKESPAPAAASRATETPTQTSPFSPRPASAAASATAALDEPAERTVVARISMESFVRIQEGKQEAPTWFMALHGQPKGPIVKSAVLQALRSGELEPTGLVWHAGWPSWVPAETVTELQEAFLPQRVPSALVPDDSEFDDELEALDHPSDTALPAAGEEPQSTMVAAGLSSDDVDSGHDVSISDTFALNDAQKEELLSEMEELGMEQMEELDIGPVTSTPAGELQDTSTATPSPATLSEPPAGSIDTMEPVGREEPTDLHVPSESTELEVAQPQAAPVPAPFGSPAPSPFDAPASSDSLFAQAESKPAPPSPFGSPAPSPFDAPTGGSPFDSSPSPFGGSPFESAPGVSMGGEQVVSEVSEKTAFTPSVELLSNFGQSPAEERGNIATPVPLALESNEGFPTSVPGIDEPTPEPQPTLPQKGLQAEQETGEFEGLPSSDHLAASDEEALFFERADSAPIPVTIAHTSHGDEALMELELPPLPVEEEVSIDDADILEIKEELKHIKKKSSPIIPILLVLIVIGAVVGILVFGPPLSQIRQRISKRGLKKKVAVAPTKRTYKQTAQDRANAKLLMGVVDPKKPVVRKAAPRKVAKKVVRRRRSAPPRARRRIKTVKIAMVKAKKPVQNDAMAMALAQMAKLDKRKKPQQRKVDLSGVTAPKGVSRALISSMYKEVNRHMRQVKYCYELHLKNATFSGRLIMDLEIKPSGKVGKVTAMTSRFRRKKVTRCIQRSMRRWKFPAFNAAKPLHLQVPYDLRPIF